MNVSTFENEDLLPRVPLPTLDASRARFLEWCAPLLTDAEFAETEAALADFVAGPGPELQATLSAYNDSPGVRSWLDTFWPYRYLGRRDRIALNANFFFLFQDAGLGQIERAAELAASAVDYKLKLDDELLPPVVLRGQPQSMVQQKYLFSATRIPGKVQDSTRTPYSDEWPGPSRERHIVVFHRDTPFRLDVVAADGRPHTPSQIAAALRAIVKDGKPIEDPSTAAGHFTTKARAEWAASREALLSAGNAAALDTIETALFCVVLEDFAPADTQEACDKLLHGDSGNRWFDKAVSVIVFEDGTAGINVEHCELDGTTILAFTDALLTSERLPRDAASDVPEFSRVEFTLTDSLREDAREAGAAFAAYADATATKILSFTEFGAKRAKTLGMSPDGFAQMAYQLAHRRAKGLTGATYESIATRQFQNGRTEAMRVVTPEAVAFVDAMESPTSTEDRQAAFRAAAAKHVQRAKECQGGDAPEQHLWELQLIGKRRGDSESHAFFASPGWLKLRNDYLSTSSAPSVNIQYFGFGSTSPQCIGVAYVLLPDRLNIYLCTPKHVADEMHKFADELTKAVQELQDLLSA